MAFFMGRDSRNDCFAGPVVLQPPVVPEVSVSRRDYRISIFVEAPLYGTLYADGPKWTCSLRENASGVLRAAVARMRVVTVNVRRLSTPMVVNSVAAVHYGTMYRGLVHLPVSVPG